MVGVGGLKSADWASSTHILYLSAVEPAYRGLGIGRALVAARIEWIMDRNREGRILVSTTRPKRYRHFGFSELRPRQSASARLMFLDFG
jgi:GNAT superfamily N-acetyltransferase